MKRSGKCSALLVAAQGPAGGRGPVPALPQLCVNDNSGWSVPAWLRSARQAADLCCLYFPCLSFAAVSE